MRSHRITKVAVATTARKRNPAFVYNFLGNVNLFHGRVENDHIYIGDAALEVESRLPGNHTGTMRSNPHASSANGRECADANQALLYVRPHLLDIELKSNGSRNHFRATVLRINPAGLQVKIELRAIGRFGSGRTRT